MLAVWAKGSRWAMHQFLLSTRPVIRTRKPLLEGRCWKAGARCLSREKGGRRKSSRADRNMIQSWRPMNAPRTDRMMEGRATAIVTAVVDDPAGLDSACKASG